MSETLIHTACEGVLTLTLNRPERRNAMDVDLIERLQRVLDEAAGDDRTRVIVLTGRGSAFCAGLDLDDMRRDAAAIVERFGALLARIESFPKAMLMAVNGDAVAGGCALAALSDVTVANERARFGLPGIRRGFFAGVIIAPLARQLGHRVLRHLMVDGHLVNAERALALGLVDELVHPDELLGRAEDRARRLAGNPLDIVMHTKTWLRQAHDRIPPLLTARDGMTFGRLSEES